MNAMVAARVLAPVVATALVGCGAETMGAPAAVSITRPRLSSRSAVGESVVNHSAFTGVTQKIAWGVGLDSQDPHWLRIRNYPDITSSIPDEEYWFSAAYEILDVAHEAKKDIFYVMGLYLNGDYVIERWKRMRHVAKYPASGGSSYSLSRKVLYQGASLGAIEAIGVDGRGRYLMVLHGSPRAISRLDAASGQVAPVFDESQIPELSEWTSGLFPQLHSSQGVIWTMTLADRFLVLGDADDDGIVDSWTVLDPHSYWSEYGMSGGIVDDYTFNQ